jgi:long-chain acyl-CoA synthetase
VSYILRDAGCRMALVDEVAALQGVELVDPAKLQIIAMEGELGPVDEALPARHRFSALREAGKAALAEDPALGHVLERIAAELRLWDPMTFVYTSGTTGLPKGVVLSHKNIVYEAWAIKNVVPVDDTDEQLLVLPLAHIFARHLVWGAVEQGAVTAVGEGEAQLGANLVEVAPTFMGGVPRMYEKTYARIVRKISGSGRVTRRAFRLALDTGRKISALQQRGQIPPASLALRYAVAERAFFRQVQGLFGGRLRFFVCGGASLSQDIAEFFHACGVLILEGYGLTETTGATTVNRPDRFRFGTVGPAMPGCEIRIAPDGEILVRGNNVMMRYHELPADTQAAFDEQGWLRTGDIGELRDGFLRITDRKKDLFKTTAGKYVAPRMIEGRLRLRDGIAHVLVYGEGRPYAVALVALDAEAMMQRSDAEGLGCRTHDDLVVHPRVRQIVASHVDAVNATLARYEAIRRFAIVPRPFTVAGGELTPTRKVRRKVVLDRYPELVEGLYEGDALPPWDDSGKRPVRARPA